MISDIIYGFLTGATEIQNYCDGRVYPLSLPEEFDKHNVAVPFIVYQIAAIDPFYSKSVTGHVPNVYDITVDFAAYAYKYADVQRGFDVLLGTLHTLIGSFGMYNFVSADFISGTEDYLDSVKLRVALVSYTFKVKKEQ